MEIIKASYKGDYKLAVAENEAQERNAINAIDEIMGRAFNEERRINGLLKADNRALLETEERVYLELRLMEMEKLGTRLANAKAEAAGIFDIEKQA